MKTSKLFGVVLGALLLGGCASAQNPGDLRDLLERSCDTRVYAASAAGHEAIIRIGEVFDLHVAEQQNFRSVMNFADTLAANDEALHYFTRHDVTCGEAYAGLNSVYLAVSEMAGAIDCHSVTTCYDALEQFRMFTLPPLQ